MSYKSKYKSSEIEYLLDKVASGEIGGGGGSSSGGPNVVEFQGPIANITAVDNTIFLTDNYIETLNLDLNYGYFPVGFRIRFRNFYNIQLNISGYEYASDLHYAIINETPQLPELFSEGYTEISVASAGLGAYTRTSYNIFVVQFAVVY